MVLSRFKGVQARGIADVASLRREEKRRDATPRGELGVDIETEGKGYSSCIK